MSEQSEIVLHEYKPVRYRPTSVRGALKEMKDLSELMVDVAYSSVLFNDDELAGEVLLLGERMGHLSYQLVMNASLAARDGRDAEQVAGILKAESSIHKIAGAARDIAIVQLRKIGIDPSIQQAFEKAEERLAKTAIHHDSILAGKRLGDLKLQVSIGVDIIGVRRGKRWYLNPKPDFKLLKGDIVIARGSEVGVPQLTQLAKGELKEVP